VKLRSPLSFSEPASVIDPCVGQGTALQLVTSDAPVRRYGIELDAERARIAGSKGIEIIQGNTFGDSGRNYPTSSKAAKRRESQGLLRLS
jgi:hypothetical protein